MDLYLGFHVLALHSRLLRWLVLGHGGNLVFVVLQNVVNKLKKMALGYMPTILFYKSNFTFVTEMMSPAAPASESATTAWAPVSSPQRLLTSCENKYIADRST